MLSIYDRNQIWVKMNETEKCTRKLISDFSQTQLLFSLAGVSKTPVEPQLCKHQCFPSPNVANSAHEGPAN